MCQFTVPGTARGDNRHRYYGEVPCGECKAAANQYKRSLRQGIDPDGYGREYWHFTWKNYRIRRPEYEAILARQQRLCAVCGDPLQWGTKNTHVDHNHACDHEGKGRRCCADCVRGILCRRCNLGIAILDDPQWLAKAARYLGDEGVAEVLRENRLF